MNRAGIKRKEQGRNGKYGAKNSVRTGRGRSAPEKKNGYERITIKAKLDQIG